MVLERRIYAVFSVFGPSRFKNDEYALCLACLGSHVFRTKNIHCLTCLGYRALRTKNIHCGKHVWALMFLERRCLACLGSHAFSLSHL